MTPKQPILLSFYALSNGEKLMVFGYLTHSLIKDLSFTGFSSTKTFFTLLSLYRTSFVSEQQIEIIFNTGKATTSTDKKGSFYLTADLVTGQKFVLDIQINGVSVTFMKELYDLEIHEIKTDNILISDIDDTVIHSYISNKFMKFLTLMFTSVERRRAVEPTMKLIRDQYALGVEPFYLSNSEQNLYPLIYRFLKHNNFPKGPIFLKEMRKLRDVFRGKKFPEQSLHKLTTLNLLLRFFTNKKFIFVGDNTQQDLDIYLSMAEKFPESIKYIIILKVVNRPADDEVVAYSTQLLQQKGIVLYYGDKFPSIEEL
ncbi:phosphatidate phosphatase App1 family protein [Cytophaga aurantiaca]|uniref:phosphatidate phosphatase App1 family protein n=1 Tax=Cytophaga aurantiaca TaxID=29530 RepID=UPI0003695DB4|nr:App1 family protein [Cytophaga aurantiaca]